MRFKVGNKVRSKNRGKHDITRGADGIIKEVFDNNDGDQNYRVDFEGQSELLGYGEWELELIARDFHDIFRQIRNQIPETETEFLKDLDWVIEDAKFKAPEDDSPWHRCFDVLDQYIGIPKEDWEIKIWSIFSETPENEIREQIEEAS